MRFGGNMNQMMKQVKKLQEQMQQIQAELKNKTVEGTAGGGMVTVTMNGHKEVLAVRIQPEAVDPDDLEMLEDLVRAAINNALKAVDELIERDMGKLAGGINLPGLL